MAAAGDPEEERLLGASLPDAVVCLQEAAPPAKVSVK